MDINFFELAPWFLHPHVGVRYRSVAAISLIFCDSWYHIWYHSMKYFSYWVSELNLSWRPLQPQGREEKGPGSITMASCTSGSMRVGRVFNLFQKIFGYESDHYTQNVKCL